MTFNHLNRRTHLYLALALMPWLLIYALSALAIQHRTLFTDEKGPTGPSVSNAPTTARLPQRPTCARPVPKSSRMRVWMVCTESAVRGPNA